MCESYPSVTVTAAAAARPVARHEGIYTRQVSWAGRAKRQGRLVGRFGICLVLSRGIGEKCIIGKN